MPGDAAQLPAEAAVLIHAPLGGDGPALAREAERCGLPARVCDRSDDLEAALQGEGAEAALFVIVSEEGAGERTGRVLDRVHAEEPAWSRLPVVFLVGDAAAPPEACRMLDRVDNAPPFILLTRPIGPSVLRHLLQVQAEARRRQFEVRDLLARLEREEARKGLLLSELRHRVRNSLAVLQSLFKMSARRAGSVEELAESFSARLRNLVDAHVQLTEEDEGARDLRGLLEKHVAPYRFTDAALRLEGPPARLSRQVAFDLAMVIHELATNATKYGALSVDEGRVEARWSVDPERGALRLEWRERGGPEVQAPTRQGLGTQLIRSQFAGGPRDGLRFEREGLVWTGEIPAGRFELAEG